MHAAFSAEAAFFEAAEGAGGVELVVGVAPDDARLEFLCDFEHFAAFVGPDAGGEAIGRVVGFADGFFDGAETHEGEDRAEDFFACDGVRRLHVGEETRLAPVAFAGQRRHAGRAKFGTFFDTQLEIMLDAVALFFAVDCANVGVLVQRVAHAQARETELELLANLVQHALLHQQS